MVNNLIELECIQSPKKDNIGGSGDSPEIDKVVEGQTLDWKKHRVHLLYY